MDYTEDEMMNVEKSVLKDLIKQCMTEVMSGEESEEGEMMEEAPEEGVTVIDIMPVRKSKKEDEESDW